MKKNIITLINLILVFFVLSFTAFAEEDNNNQQQSDKQEIVYNTPDEIKGVLVSPETDFATEPLQSEEAVKTQINNIINTISDNGLNTVYLNLQTSKGVIYNSEYFPIYTSFDALQYFIEQAKANEIFVYAVMNPCYVSTGDSLVDYKYIYSDLISQSQQNIAEVVSKYNIDAILIEGYYNSINDKSFEEYRNFSSGVGFEQWMKEITTSLVKSLSDIVKKTNPAVQFGLVVDSVWANNNTLPTGSATSDEFEMYTDGFVDLPTIMTLSNINTLLVKLPGSTVSKTIPFKSTLKWWKDTLKDYNTDICALIYNSKLSTNEKGWASPDQVIQQIISTRDVNTKGAVFASYKHIAENKDNHTDLIKRFYKGQVKVQDILTTLTVSRPDKLVYSTYEPNVSFYGASDPNFPLLLNGDEVERNDKGVFSLEIELKAGENIFEFSHKTKTVKYVITRNIKIIQSVSPEGAMNVEGNSVIPITVSAYKDSNVVATIGGVTLNLVPSDREDDSTNKDSNYIQYIGNYQCPPSSQSAQNIGNIKVSATWQGITQSATGANISVTALPAPEIMPGERGNMVEVVANQARTYPSSVINADPSGDCFPLPQGSKDFIASDLLTFTSGGKNYSYYILRSGVRVNASDVKVVGETELVSNNVTEASLYSDGGFTYLKLKQDQPMAYKATLPNLGFDTNDGINTFNSSSITFTFNQVENIPGNISVSENNIFSSATITKNGNNAVVSLNFHRAGRFAGYKAYYQDGYLVFRFTNIPSSLAGARIYIDPGHGGVDSGTLPIEGMKTEAQINRELASKVATILRERGATVQVTDTTNTVSLSSRVAMSQSFAPHLFISLHQNSATSPNARGTEVWFFNPYSEIYADRISQGVANALQTRDRGEKYGWYYVTTHMEFPAVLVENGFLSNVNEYDKLKDENYQNAISVALANSIESVFSSI